MEVFGCQFPEDRLYDCEATVWVKLYEEHFTLGVTQLYTYLLGRVRMVSPKPQNTHIQKGKGVVYIESASFSGYVNTPLSGVLLQVNQTVLQNPFVVNKDPYYEGWIAKLKTTNVQEVETLVSAEALNEKVKAIALERGVRCFSVYPVYKVSGIGGECPETLKSVEDILERAEKEDVLLLVTDNPRAQQDVPSWVEAHGYHIVEARFEQALKYYIIRK